MNLNQMKGTKMEKEKIIEEMANEVCPNNASELCASGKCPKFWECPLNIQTIEILAKKGYRKCEPHVDKADYIELYKAFRQELDEMCVPGIVDDLKIFEPIIADGKLVGMCAGFTDYIDCLYVLPEYRRKGLAKKTVLKFVEGNLDYGIRLHIINNNEVAFKFWNSVFELNQIGTNPIDTLFEIKSIKGEKANET